MAEIKKPLYKKLKWLITIPAIMGIIGNVINFIEIRNKIKTNFFYLVFFFLMGTILLLTIWLCFNLLLLLQIYKVTLSLNFSLFSIITLNIILLLFVMIIIKKTKENISISNKFSLLSVFKELSQ